MDLLIRISPYIAVALVIGLAIIILIRHLSRTLKGKSGCHGCSSAGQSGCAGCSLYKGNIEYRNTNSGQNPTGNSSTDSDSVNRTDNK